MSEIYAVNESFFKMILSRHSLGAKHLVIPPLTWAPCVWP